MFLFVLLLSYAQHASISCIAMLLIMELKADVMMMIGISQLLLPPPFVVLLCMGPLVPDKYSPSSSTFALSLPLFPGIQQTTCTFVYTHTYCCVQTINMDL